MLERKKKELIYIHEKKKLLNTGRGNWFDFANRFEIINELL